MHMVPVQGARSWSSSPGALPAGRRHAVVTPLSVRVGRGNGGDRTAVLCLSSAGGDPLEPADSPWDGRLVDEGMATLRRRIREVRAAAPTSGPEDDEEEKEKSSVDGGNVGLPAEWTELERRHHESYVAGVREAAGVLQELLLRARPGLAAGVVALVLLSVPASVLIVSSQLIEAVNSISSAVMKGRM